MCLPVNDVGEKVVVPQPVVDVDLLVVDRERARAYAPLVLLGRVGPELPGEHLEDLLAHPAALREGREGEVVRVDLTETCNSNDTDALKINWNFGRTLSNLLVVLKNITMLTNQQGHCVEILSAVLK